jgi:tRNA U34 5-carboxymethylaminomethyl modifying GTPase MnmE/TrmE
MANLSEPICALITPPGYAAINIVRISGKGSIGIVAQYFKPAKNYSIALLIGWYLAPFIPAKEEL